MVAWRMGMAQCAAFVAGLDDVTRAKVAASALRRLGEPVAPLVRSMIVIAARC
jgi:hypothetical protein